MRTAMALEEIGLVEESAVYREAMDRKLENVLERTAKYVRDHALAFDLRP